jgi:hypothetical protein
MFLLFSSDGYTKNYIPSMHEIATHYPAAGVPCLCVCEIFHELYIMATSVIKSYWGCESGT